jgi:hypothetical protein
LANRTVAGSAPAPPPSRACAAQPPGLVQHLGLAHDLGMTAHSHLNTAHLLDPASLVEQGKIVADTKTGSPVGARQRTLA